MKLVFLFKILTEIKNESKKIKVPKYIEYFDELFIFTKKQNITIIIVYNNVIKVFFSKEKLKYFFER